MNKKEFIKSELDELLHNNLSKEHYNIYLNTFSFSLTETTPKQREYIQKVTELFFDVYKRSNYEIETLADYLANLILCVSNSTNIENNKGNSKHYKDFIKFKKLVLHDFRETHNAKDYASKLNYSYKYINQISKELTGITAKAYIDNHIISEIKRDIAQNCYSIKEICFRNGFVEPTNFARFFKKHTGMTPNNFAKKLRND